MKNVLEKALLQQINKRSKSEYLFYSSKSKGLKAISEYPKSIGRILDTLFNNVKEEGEERIVPYTFRHTFANLLLQVHKVPIFDVSAMLNHASVETTIKNYIEFNNESVIKDLECFEAALIAS